ncbi:MAG: alpha/beta fold hydrolase [Actinomycetota bacterium]|nr:alpha/beta fold hydrolase [Actinomycetota bacterium]
MERYGTLELPESQWVDVNGPVHYREWEGPSRGPTFVCVHGLGGSLINWASVAPGLARHGRVLALDLAGFGLTPAAGRKADVGSNRKLLNGFLKAHRLRRVVLVGNSMGGKVCLIQAAHAPSSVKGLILTDAVFPRARALSGQPSVQISLVFALYSNRRLGQMIASSRARRLGAEGLVKGTLRLCAADPSSIDPDLVEAHIELARRRMEFDYATSAFLEAARSIFRTQVTPGKYRRLVERVEAPALVMHGEKDRLVPVGAAREAAGHHDNWELAIFPDLGHIPQMEAPDRWLETVEGWLPAISRRPSAARRAGRRVPA